MRIIDDEVGMKEKPEDTRYIKRLHRNETRECGKTKDLIPNCMPLLGTADTGMGGVVIP